jgi:hypothetical protein
MAEKLEGQALTQEQIKKAAEAQDKILANVNHVMEADVCAQEILELLPRLWAERGLSPEQSVFSIAMATVHLREKFPGGKQRFDEVAREAHLHYLAKPE